MPHASYDEGDVAELRAEDNTFDPRIRTQWDRVMRALERAYEYYSQNGDSVDFYRAAQALMCAYDSWLD